MSINRGSVDYDLDKYGRKIRKYIVTKMTKVHGKSSPLWEQVVDFVPETDIPRNYLDTKKKRW